MAATHMSAMQYGTVSVNPASINDQQRGSIDVTITGVAPGDLVSMEPPSALEVGLCYGGCKVTAVDTVRIHLYNSSGAAVNGAALDWTYFWIDRT